MFIKTSQSGYNRNGEQFARGSFLMIFSHNQYKWEEQNNKPHPELKGQWLPTAEDDNFIIRAQCTCEVTYYYLKSCPVHKHEWKDGKDLDSKKLYACVRHVSLRAFGHFMMGTARIAGQCVTVSGSYGNDGLPGDYEALTPAARKKLVEVPQELAAQFWKGGGHNTAGKEAPAMREWARKTFKGGGNDAGRVR